MSCEAASQDRNDPRSGPNGDTVNRPIRRVAVFVGLLMLAVLVNLNWVQVVHANSYRSNAANRRVLLDEYKRQRGSIIVQGTQIAESVETTDSLKYLRRYPFGPVYADVTGFDSILYGKTQIEFSNDPVLSGSDDRLLPLSSLLTGRDPDGGNVVLTINKAAQQAAYDALGNRPGAVVALDPSTGAILAAVSTPTFDPNKLSSHDARAITKAYNAYSADPSDPMQPRAFSETYPPGSVFKVIVSAAALKAGRTPDVRIPAPDALTLPNTSTQLYNFDHERCGNGITDTFIHALTISCNTAFARLALDLGTGKIKDEAKLFGIDGQDFGVPVPVAGSSVGPIADQASLAQSAIGQRDVRITPLQGAMIAATVANHGVPMRPYLVQEERASNYSVLSKAELNAMPQAMTPAQADQLTSMMISVVNNGTGTAAKLPGVQVAGKTGTADNGPRRSDGTYVNRPHAWFVGFAPAGPDASGHAQTSKIAVAVILENAGVAGNEATGGKAAAPVAAAVISAYLASISGK